MDVHKTWTADALPTRQGAAQASWFPQSVALCLLCFGLITLYYLVDPTSGYVSDLVDDLIITGVAGLAAFLCLRTGRRLGVQGWPWLLLGVGCFAWFCGQIVWDLYQLGPARRAPYPSFADIGFFLFRPLCFAGIVGIIRPGRLRLSLDLVLDILIIVMVVAAFDYQFVLAPLWEGPGGANMVSLVSIASQVGTLALVLLAIIAFLWSPELRSQPAILLVMVGLVVFAGANLVYGRLLLTRSYGIGDSIDLAWIGSFLLFGVAALVAQHPVSVRAATRRGGQWRASVVSRLIVIVVSVLGVVALAAYGALSADPMPVAAWAIVMVGIIIAVRLANDIVDRKHTEERMAIVRDQAVEASYLKSEFLATMSHEIRTPMNGVLGTLELLLDTELSRPQLELASTARESADALLTILNDILDLSRIEAGKMRLETVDFDPASVVEGAAEVLAGRAQAKHLLLMTYVSPAIPSLLGGDPTRLRQVLINLIANAVKFTDEGEVTVRATLENVVAPHVTVRFEVSDTGIGLSEDAQTRLFQSFSQADASTTRRYGGTGLGLAISKRLVELMGGEAGVRSEVGQGSTFWITAQFERLAQTVGVDSVITEPACAGLRVLIAGERSTNREILHSYIVSWGMRNGSVDSGDAVLKRLRQALMLGDPYDVVIIDLATPGMDGPGVAKAINADPVLASTRLILITPFNHSAQGETAVNNAVSAYLTKPIKKAQLHEAITGVKPDTMSETLVPVGDQHVLRPIALAPAQPAGDRIVLLAEDNLVNQRVAKMQVEKLGYTVAVVNNGRQALDALVAHDRYGLILMDVQMPEMDGFSATRVIREREIVSGGRIPIIAMTANTMEGDRDTCFAAGMDDYISKPVNREKLREVLAAWMPIAEGATENTLKHPHSVPIN